MKLSRLVFVAVFFFASVASVRANTDPPTWLDVQNYGADPTCTSDSGLAINNAIAAASSPGQVIFFPKGCYLINTQIVDTNSAPGLTYLGFGRVELSAGSTLTGSIMKFGSSSASVSRRRIDDLFFECNSRTGIDGVDIAGLVNSEFINVEFLDCKAFALKQTNDSIANYSNVFEGGGLTAHDASANGIYLSYSPNSWVFKGTKIIQMTSGTPTGIGLQILGGASISCLDCDIEGWNVGLSAASADPGGTSGMEISGGYFERNAQYDVQVGYSDSTTHKAYGVTIHGAYFNGQSNTLACIDLEQADSYSIFGNEFHNCKNANIYAHPDINTSGDYEGADNGIIGPNHSTGSAPDLYPNYGSNITYISGGQIRQLNSKSNCSSTASPASCGSDANGSVVVSTGTDHVVVNTTAVTANSQILLTFDSSLGTKLGVTCNTTVALPTVSARTAGTSFTIQVPSNPVTNPACYSYSIIN